MATGLMQTSEASMMTFKDYALEITVTSHRMKSLCKTLKVYDGESAGNLILILGLELENVVFNLSKHSVVI